MPFVKDFNPISLGDTNLFRPIKVGTMELNHRAVMPPMARMRASYPDYILNKDWSVEYFDQRSKYPGSLLITCAVTVSAQAGGYKHSPGIWTQDQINQWSKVYKKIHENKSFVFTQLIAVGRQAFPELLKKEGLRFDGPSSGLYMNEEKRKSALMVNNPQHGITKEEIKQYVEDFVQAAKNAINAGSDGIEIHAANGYLLNQFLDPMANQRTDEYGGSIENRSRFVLEVVDGIIDAIGAERVGIRFSPYGKFGTMSGISETTLIAQYCHIIGELEQRAHRGQRLAYIHLVEPDEQDLKVDGGIIKNCTNDFIYSIWRGIVIRTGNLSLKPAAVKQLVASNDKTLIGYARYWLANPDMVEKVKEGLPLNEYDSSTFYTLTKEGYLDYPTYNEALQLGWDKS